MLSYVMSYVYQRTPLDLKPKSIKISAGFSPESSDYPVKVIVCVVSLSCCILFIGERGANSTFLEFYRHARTSRFHSADGPGATPVVPDRVSCNPFRRERKLADLTVRSWIAVPFRKIFGRIYRGRRHFGAAAVWRICTNSPLAGDAEQNFAHASRAAAASGTDRRADRRPPPCRRSCAPAPSRPPRSGKPVRSAAQSRNVDRKPCTVRSPRPMRRSSIRNAMLLSGRPALPPGNTKSLGANRRHGLEDRHAPDRTAGPGARARLSCARPGTVQSRSARSISSQRAPMTSPVRAAVRIANSSARAAMPSCCAQLGHECRDLGIGQGGVVLDRRTLLRGRQQVSRWPRQRAGFSPSR